MVGLATLAGADARPGELIGWGPVHAELARTIAAAPGASWWYVRTDDDGTPLAIGRVRSRAEGAGSSVRGYPRPQIWLQVNQTTLDALARRSHPPGWETVIAEIAAKAKAETDTGPPNGDPTARLPGKSLRRAGSGSEIAPVSSRGAACPHTGPTPTTASRTPTAVQRSTQTSRMRAVMIIGYATKAAGALATPRPGT